MLLCFLSPPQGAEGDLDEMEWEDDVADDDEGHQHEEMASDDEEKQTKVKNSSLRLYCLTSTHQLIISGTSQEGI